MINIEFFHDTICSFCFPMSARMRNIASKRDDLNIIHRSFALGWDSSDFINMFGSREKVKDVVVGHWEVANQNDDEHRFNIEGMKKVNFNFPISRPALLASKACEIAFGKDSYWDMFDALQNNLFVENKNIEDDEVIFETIRKLGFDFEKWYEKYISKEVEERVLEDLSIARSYGIYSAPTLLVNGKYLIVGAQPQREIEEFLDKISSENI